MNSIKKERPDRGRLYFILWLGITILLTGCQSSQQAKIENSLVEIIASKTLGDYQITTYWPKGPPPKTGWPVIYLLDGNRYWLTAVNFGQTQSCERCLLEPGVIVAIDYPDSSRRAHDYLPKPSKLTPEILPNGKINIPEQYGGADQFYRFIEHELKPIIENRFPINKNRQTLFGHSYGGLLILHLFFTQPHTFQTYIASSPSVWFSDKFIFKESTAFIEKYQGNKLPIATQLQISVGGLEQSLTANEKILAKEKQAQLLAHQINRQMISSIQKLTQSLQQAKIDNLTLFDTIYAEQTHQSAPYLALLDGLKRGFNRYLTEHNKK